MDSITLQLEGPEKAAELAEKLRTKNPALHVSPMDAYAKDVNEMRRQGRSIFTDLDGLLIGGEREDIEMALLDCLGSNWKDFVVSGFGPVKRG